MKRAIKFTALRADNGEWVEGYYIGSHQSMLDMQIPQLFGMIHPFSVYIKLR